MRRETQNVLLVLTGGALLKIAFGGSYLRYVKPSQQPLLVAAGVVMLLLAAVAIVRDIRARQPRTSCGTTGSEHARSAWMLLLPVLAIFVVAPPALGSDSVNRDSARDAATERTATFPPLPPGKVVELPMNEFVARAGWDSRDSLAGRTVRLTGFVVRDEHRVRLARMVITCCAADASPLTITLRGGEFTGLRSDDWLRVTGEVEPGSATEANNYQPVLRVATLRRVAAPDHPYEQ
ncbi:MAG: TIGR03943 family protein [Pseudonocardiaceae bacterium]|nr:TIGR03943 family protein [Pseudonocardiaceae bacterium]